MYQHPKVYFGGKRLSLKRTRCNSSLRCSRREVSDLEVNDVRTEKARGASFSLDKWGARHKLNKYKQVNSRLQTWIAYGEKEAGGSGGKREKRKSITKEALEGEVWLVPEPH